jgi:hypothetical protein
MGANQVLTCMRFAGGDRGLIVLAQPPIAAQLQAIIPTLVAKTWRAPKIAGGLCPTHALFEILTI